MRPLLRSKTSSISSRERAALPLPPLRRGPRLLRPRARDAGGDRGGVVAGERAGAGAEAAAGVGGSDAAAARPDLGGDQRALGVRIGAHRAGEILGLERRQIHDCRAGPRARPSPGSAASAPSRARAGADRPAAAPAPASVRSSVSPPPSALAAAAVAAAWACSRSSPAPVAAGRPRPSCASASAAAGTGCRTPRSTMSSTRRILRKRALDSSSPSQGSSYSR